MGVMIIFRLIDDLADGLYSFLKSMIRSLCYFIAGMVIVGLPLYLVALAFKYVG